MPKRYASARRCDCARTLTAVFPAEPASPGRARRLLGDALHGLGYDQDAVDTAALVLSELASNAVRHARTPFTIDVTQQARLLRLSVEDRQPIDATSEPLPVAPTHGLAVVEALTRRWGVERTAAGKAVWVELYAHRR